MCERCGRAACIGRTGGILLRACSGCMRRASECRCAPLRGQA